MPWGGRKMWRRREGWVGRVVRWCTEERRRTLQLREEKGRFAVSAKGGAGY